MVVKVSGCVVITVADAACAACVVVDVFPGNTAACADQSPIVVVTVVVSPSARGTCCSGVSSVTVSE